MTKTVVLVRGLPGSGKSTLAASITDYNVAADDYFDLFNNGEFDTTKLKRAHDWCFEKFAYGVDTGAKLIAVHNTFTQEWEFEKYMDFALENGYIVHTIIVENRHSGDSVHDVPEKTVEKMRNRFSVRL